MMTDRALTVKDVAARYGVTSQRIYDWIKGGHIRPIRLPGGRAYRFRQSDLDEFESRCRVESSSDQTTDSEDVEIVGTLIGPTPRVVELGPFQRGRLSARKPRNGGTNG
jgi:excisionase family DNA binding protein